MDCLLGSKLAYWWNLIGHMRLFNLKHLKVTFIFHVSLWSQYIIAFWKMKILITIDSEPNFSRIAANPIVAHSEKINKKKMLQENQVLIPFFFFLIKLIRMLLSISCINFMQLVVEFSLFLYKAIVSFLGFM